VFYGIGARLDAQPELLFTLRKVDAKDLVARAGKTLPLPKKQPGTRRVLESSKLAELFGIEMAEADAAPGGRGKSTAVKGRASTRRKNKAGKTAGRAGR
jgi:hypothetical protein